MCNPWKVSLCLALAAVIGCTGPDGTGKGTTAGKASLEGAGKKLGEEAEKVGAEIKAKAGEVAKEAGAEAKKVGAEAKKVGAEIKRLCANASSRITKALRNLCSRRM
jgi:hypothetical protein